MLLLFQYHGKILTTNKQTKTDKILRSLLRSRSCETMIRYPYKTAIAAVAKNN